MNQATAPQTNPLWTRHSEKVYTRSVACHGAPGASPSAGPALLPGREAREADQYRTLMTLAQYVDLQIPFSL